MSSFPSEAWKSSFILRNMISWSSLCLLVLSFASPCCAQVPPRSQSPTAVAGEPFGVLSVEVPLPNDWDGRTPRIIVSDDQGRLFYPVVTVETVELRDGVALGSGGVAGSSGGPRIGRPGGIVDRVRSAIENLGDSKTVPVAIQIHALFRGQDPFKLRLQGDLVQEIKFVPEPARRDATTKRMMGSWWDAYVQNASTAIAGNNVPKLVHYYLTSMLGRRFDLPIPDLDPPDKDKKSDKNEEKNQPLETLALLAAIEPLREEILERVIREPVNHTGELAVPPEPVWQPTSMPAVPSEVEIEAIAHRIPPECFYLRFGSFNNYLWFQELAERFGGDLTQAFFLRGFNYESTKRIERMLAAKLTTVAKMFGDKLVGDMALFGSDLYMNEGASLGVVFNSNNPALLKTAIEADRRNVLSKNKDAKLVVVSIEGRNVSLLTTPDNRIRSFFIVEDNHVVLTTSQYLMQRYLQVLGGEPSLATTETFKWARTWMPDSNGYSVFAYLSPDFFHRLVSPQYQIELRRRLEAVAHLELAESATMAAKAEGLDIAESIPALKQNRFLPPWFDNRPDGSQLLRSGDRWIDAARGTRGAFLPIADMKIQTVSQTEADQYAKVAQFYQQQWKKMDPILFGIRRYQGEQAGLERVFFEGHIAPFEAKKYGWIARQLADPSPLEIVQPADDAAELQVHMRGDRPGDDYYLFAGVKDMMPPEPEEVQGLIKTVRALRSAPAYIGAWPKPSLIELLPLGLGATMARPDALGYSRIIGGLWRWQNQQWSLLSFDRSILESAIPQLSTRQSSDYAQVRFNVSNLRNTKLERWINAFWWERGWRASHGNALLLDTLHQQLKVPNDQCLDAAGKLIDVKLQCPLGGTYVTSKGQASDPFELWQSTAWERGSLSQRRKPLPPPDYQAPWIQWFRGGRIQAVQQSSSLSVIGLLELELPPLRATETDDVDPSAFLPKLNFDVFSLPMKMFGGGSNDKDKVQPDDANKNKAPRRSF